MSNRTTDTEKETTGGNNQNNPYDPNKVSIDTKPVTMDAILRRMRQGSLIMNPNFQRKEVWDETKKSLLIESLMLKIPIPMFYVSCDKQGTMTVIDGLQRLSAIRDYIVGSKKSDDEQPQQQRLTNLEYWTEFNNKSFSELPEYLQNRILETEFTFTIVNPSTPEEVKQNIFKRINTGGVPLNLQEIRNAMFSGKSTELLQRLSKSTAFKTATCSSIKSERMVDEEMVLRCLYFLLYGYEVSDNKTMDDKLATTMERLNGKEDAEIEFLYKSLITAMNRCHQLFGDQAFRKSSRRKAKSPINKCLFEVWSHFMAKIQDSDYKIILCHKDSFVKKYEAILQDKKFIGSISQGTWSSTSIEERFGRINKLITEYTNVK